jgi:hypothetical protein
MKLTCLAALKPGINSHDLSVYELHASMCSDRYLGLRRTNVA